MKQILIENDRRVDIAYSDQLVADMAKSGWTVIADLTDFEWEEVYKTAWKHAQQNGKHCDIRKPLSEDERLDLLARVYEHILSWPDNDEDFRETNEKEEQNGTETE